MENLDVFEQCRVINRYIEQGEEEKARNTLIQLLDKLDENQYSPIVNHLIRQMGLYPYIQTETAHWEDRFVKEVFKVDTGAKEPQTLHREQSALLKKLLNGTDIVVSAPTSFGKSFIIDAFITIKNPTNVVIIVPTIALTDETRRRLHRKFADQYKIITHSDIELGEKNIFIFPQERAISYINKIPDIDIFIVDEFYKADSNFDKDRSSALMKIILEFSNKATQRYFLSPHIENIKNNPLTKNMEFIDKLKFNTVYSEIHNIYEDCNSLVKEELELFKQNKLLEILSMINTKSLIYVGTYNDTDKVSKILNDNFSNKNDELLDNFSNWLKINYSQNYILSDLVRKGCGIHNGRLHRSLSQLQVYLFSEKDIDNLISTSSIIEGVNTSAENVIIWKSKNGSSSINDFTYKNIIGRSGRMFRYFIGKIYLLDKPPVKESTELSLNLSEDVIVSLNNEQLENTLSGNTEQKEKAKNFHLELMRRLGEDIYNKIINDDLLKLFNKSEFIKIAYNMVDNRSKWNNINFNYLNNENTENWNSCLYLTLKFCKVETRHGEMVEFIKIINNNWNSTIPDLLHRLEQYDIKIDDFFKLERNLTFNISTALNQINRLYKYIFPEKNIDISPFIYKVSNAFLPKLVYELEEYGLPRMVSKKIHNSGIIDLENKKSNENEKPDINQVIEQFNRIGRERIKQQITDLHPFEEVILDYFFDGIETDK